MVKKNLYTGLFLITMSTLMYEILLTRIFSVTMWYHFAFVAISIGMFGMTAGATLVYLLPNFFRLEKVYNHLSISSILFSAATILSFLTHLTIPYSSKFDIVSIYSLGLNYFVVSIPFIFSGIAVTLILTKFPDRIGKLYFADLLGAAVGCIVLIYFLDIIGDAPTVVFVIAFFASVGSLVFAEKKPSFLRLSSLFLSLSLLLFVILNSYLAGRQQSLIKLKYTKGFGETEQEYERWNSFSRIIVYPDAERSQNKYGWGISRVFPKNSKVEQKILDIDAYAATYLTKFDGDIEKVSHLKYDVTNIVHYLGNGKSILIVGAGGGRDILSALVFGQKKIDAVEINENIIDAITGPYGDYTGHPEKNPGVRLINDEARSYIARSNDKYDIIQVSLIDTWAATAAGAFVMSENSLYTEEAWMLMLEKLSEGGIISFSRWYFRDNKSEMYRLAALAGSALRKSGIRNIGRNIVIVRNMKDGQDEKALNEGVGTLLVSAAPFTSTVMDSLEAVCGRLEFDIVFSPAVCKDSTYRHLFSDNADEFIKNYPMNISPPTDDNPFFFHLLSLGDTFNPGSWNTKGLSQNYKAVLVLAVLLLVVIVLTGLFIILPLKYGSKSFARKNSIPFFIYYIAIGFGFMLIELSQMQRLIIFLGHPVYGLSVVLFALLLFSGIGSYFSGYFEKIRPKSGFSIPLAILLLLLICFGIITPFFITGFQGSTTPARILVSVAILIPPAFFMGMAFPIGMKAASAAAPGLTPWLWGMNGAASVCASVLSVVIAMYFGISISFWFGFVCYLAAFASLIWINRRVKLKT